MVLVTFKCRYSGTVLRNNIYGDYYPASQARSILGRIYGSDQFLVYRSLIPGCSVSRDVRLIPDIDVGVNLVVRVSYPVGCSSEGFHLVGCSSEASPSFRCINGSIGQSDMLPKIEDVVTLL